MEFEIKFASWNRDHQGRISEPVFRSFKGFPEATEQAFAMVRAMQMADPDTEYSVHSIVCRAYTSHMECISGFMTRDEFSAKVAADNA